MKFAALFLVASVCALLPGPTVAEGQQSATLSPPVADRGGVGEFRDLPYVAGGHERQRLDLFVPPGTDKQRPLLVWIHGGGWEGGTKNGSPAKALVTRGFVVASIGYRLSQHAKYPAQIEDCKAAIRWLRANAHEYGFDPKRVGVWGASAGGHLAALVGTTGDIRDFDVGEHLEQSSAVACVLNWFGPSDFLNYGDPVWRERDYPNNPAAKLLGGPVMINQDKARRASPITFAKPGTPPFLIMQGDRDTIVPMQQSEILHAALRKLGVKSELIILPGAAHGGAQFTTPEMKKRMVEFLESHLKTGRS